MKFALFAALAAGALTLAACDNGPSAVAQKQAAGTQMADNSAASAADETSLTSPSGADTPQVDHRKEAVKLVDGKPMWSASRKFSASANAQRAFDRNGRAFGADNLDEFVKQAHAFVEHPPRGTLTMTRRNGDTLFYDPKGNVFAVASREGAPRTMFKPDDGRAYWEEQKTREAKSRTARRSRGGDDEA
jgi:pyocin large subunit-like protein